MAKVLLDPAFEFGPQHPGQVEEDGQGAQVERHPLVVGVVEGSFVGVPRGGARTLVLGVDVEVSVHPAERVQHVEADKLVGVAGIAPAMNHEISRTM